MTLRMVLLRAMLWSLGLSAVTGVLAVLFQAGDLVWRVVGTGFTTAVACGLMLPASTLIDQEKSRPAGLLGMAGVILEFLMAMILIWEAPRNLWGVSWEGEIVLTMLFLGMAVVLIMAFLALLREAYGVVAGRVGLIVTLRDVRRLHYRHLDATRPLRRRVGEDERLHSRVRWVGGGQPGQSWQR